MSIWGNGNGGSKHSAIGLIGLVLAIISPVVSVLWVASNFRVDNEHRMTAVEQGEDRLATQIADLKDTVTGQIADQSASTQAQISDIKASIAALWQQVGHANGLLMQGRDGK